MMIHSRRLASGACAAFVAVVGALSGPGSASASAPYAPPPANAPFDYQIGAAYTPPAGVQVVSRDHAAAPVKGLYNLCYVNAFQGQTEDTKWWTKNHGDLVLKDAKGKAIIDPDWNEVLLDTSTAAKRDALAVIVGGWISGCATAGFQAVEPDNIDSYQRSKNLLTKADAIAFLQLLAARAHAAGLAIAQKNTTELGTAGKAAGLDFAIAEECGRYSECGDYTSVYGSQVIDIEYTDKGFTKACTAIGATSSVVRRDVDVTAPGSHTYVYNAC
jgi:hypothetical protein